MLARARARTNEVEPESPDDAIDLTVEQRQRIEDVHSRLAELTPHALLGVPEDADRASVRRAYFARVAEFHTDRFFRKRLGSYKPKMEAISNRLTEAYDALKGAGSGRRAGSSKPAAPPRDSGAARAAPATGPRPNAAPSPSPPAPPAAPDPGREKALAALKQQLEARRAQARKLVADAERAERHGDTASAAELYRKAAALAPGDASIQEALSRTRASLDAGAADALARQAEFEERFGHWAEAARTWKRVLDARPDDARAKERLVAATAKAGAPAPGGQRR
jgi:tetratricopeptide (TPR) repeat protein